MQFMVLTTFPPTLETETPRSYTTSESILPTSVSPAPNRVYLTGPGGGAEEAVLRSPGFEEKKGESSYPPNSNVVFVVTAQKGQEIETIYFLSPNFNI